VSSRPRHLAAGTDRPRRTRAALLPDAVLCRVPLALFLLAGCLAAAALVMIVIAPDPTSRGSDRDASGATTVRPGDPGEGIGAPARRTPPPPAPVATQSPVEAPGGVPVAGAPVGDAVTGDPAPGDPAAGAPGGGRSGGAGRDRPRGRRTGRRPARQRCRGSGFGHCRDGLLRRDGVPAGERRHRGRPSGGWRERGLQQRIGREPDRWWVDRRCRWRLDGRRCPGAPAAGAHPRAGTPAAVLPVRDGRGGGGRPRWRRRWGDRRGGTGGRRPPAVTGRPRR
jgi:hypothetical protein